MARRRSATGGSWLHDGNVGRQTRSQRQLRVGELLRHALSEVLAREEFRDPVLAGISITVTEVRVSPDLRGATCFIMPLGGADVDDVRQALARAAPWLSAQVSRRVRLKFSPTLSFQTDASFEAAERVGELLRREEVAADLSDAHRRPLNGENDGA